MIKEEILNRLRKISAEEEGLLKGETINRSIYMNQGSNEIDAKHLLERGKLITIRPHTRFVHFPEHTHNYVEMVYMCCGETTHVVNGKKIVLKEGELLILAQSATHEVYRAEENDIAVNFIILPQFFDKTLEMIQQEETPLTKFITDCLENKGNADYLYFQVGDVLPIQNLLENLLWTLEEKLPNKRRILQISMGLLFLQLMNHTDRLVYEKPEEEVVVRTLRYIEENYSDASLKELSKLLHYDLSWLSREIKHKTSKTFKQLLQEKRLSQAAYFLTCTSFRVNDIGEMVGYSNLSYFHRIFYEAYGGTPKEYRERSKRLR